MPKKSRSKGWWRKVVSRYEARRGEVTMRKFAEEEGLTYGTFSWWVHFFRHNGRKKKSPPEPVTLVPVEVTGASSAQGPTCAPLRLGNWLEAETTEGIKVRFCEGTRTEYVGDLVRRLAGGLPC